jgi:hypothetical protein
MNGRGESDLRARLREIETVLAEIEAGPESAARARTRKLVGAVLELHAAGLARILELAAERDGAGLALVERLADDPLVAGVLLLHGLHPRDLETRVRAVLQRLEPTLAMHGAVATLVSAADDVVRVRVEPDPAKPRAALAPLIAAMESALLEATPDAAGIEIDAPSDPTPGVVVPISDLRKPPARAGRVN